MAAYGSQLLQWLLPLFCVMILLVWRTPMYISMPVLSITIICMMITILEAPIGIAKKLFLWRLTIQANIAELLAGEVLKSCRGTIAAAPRPGDKAISREWLTNILRANHRLLSTREVDVVEPKGLDGNRGLAGAMTRLHITYRDAAPSSSPFAEVQKAAAAQAEREAASPPREPPVTLILKMSRPGVAGRRAAIIHGQHREALLYPSVIGREQSSLLPSVLYSYGSGLYGEQVILMEDIMSYGATPVNFIHGNQIWGIPKPVDPPRDNIMTMTAVYTMAADMHSKYWCDRKLIAAPLSGWLKGSDWYNNRGRVRWEIAMDASRTAWTQVKAKAAAATPAMIAEKKAVNLSPKLVSILDRSLAAASWPAMVSHIKSHPFTLCHGDFHAANMLLLNSSEQTIEGIMGGMRWFDWSEVGPWEGPTDLAQTIISDVRADVFRVHGRSLVDAYWQRLVAGGVKNYSKEQCFNDFARGGAERWCWVFPILAAMPQIPPVGVQYFHDQLLAFIEAFNEQPVYQLKPLVQILGPL